MGDICNNNNTSSYQIIAMAFLKIAVLALLCAMAFSNPIDKEEPEEMQDPGIFDGIFHVVGGALGGAAHVVGGVLGGAGHIVSGVLTGAHHVVGGTIHGVATALGDEQQQATTA